MGFDAIPHDILANTQASQSSQAARTMALHVRKVREHVLIFNPMYDYLISIIVLNKKASLPSSYSFAEQGSHRDIGRKTPRNQSISHQSDTKSH